MTEVNSVGVPLVETRGGTNQTSLSTGDILYSDATDSLSKLAKGDEDQVLKMGASNIPEWGAVPAGSGGGLSFLSSATLSSSAALEITSDIDATYNLYLLEVEISFAIADSLYIQCSTNGGFSYDSSGIYAWGGYQGGSHSQTTTSTFLKVTNNSTASGAIRTLVYLKSPSTSDVTAYSVSGSNISSSVLNNITFSGHYNSSTPVDAIKFYGAAGRLMTGTIKMYGMTTPS